MITREVLQRELAYDPQTGTFLRLTKRGGCAVGDRAGHTGKNGYVELNVCGTRMLAHRAAWLYAYGDLPPEIDHINRIRSDNRLSNLRAVTHSQNAINTPLRKHNTSGVRGVYFHRPSNGWLVFVQRNNQNHHIGYFKDKQKAIEARLAWVDPHAC